MDEITGQDESFFFDVDPNSFDFSISKHFTGLEWHNRVENTLYPIKFQVEISNLAYGINDDSSDLQSIAYFPYDQLFPDEGGFAMEYPVSFHNFETRNGFITYKIGSGTHHTGIVNNFFS